MPNQKKTPIAVFHILKSLMTAKEAPLKTQVEAGRRAVAELPIIQDHVIALRQVILNCRAFDPSERREAEHDLEDKEFQLQGVCGRIANGQRAEQNMAYVSAFNTTYNAVCAARINAPRIRELESRVVEIESDMDALDEKIWGCEINMDDACRSSEIVAQAQNDMIEYRAQYDELEKCVSKIKEQIKRLQK